MSDTARTRLTEALALARRWVRANAPPAWQALQTE
jgi:hypothetical protein